MYQKRKIFIDYFENKISEETLASKIGLYNEEFAMILINELEKELKTQDSEMLEFLIYALMLWDERVIHKEKISLKDFRDILNKLIVCKWHEQHENIVMLIQKIADGESIDYLYMAMHLKLKYLEWDDNYSFQVKCIRAIGKIGGKKAIGYLAYLCEDDNPLIREISKKQLEKIKSHNL